MAALEEKLCDGRFSSLTCAEDNWHGQFCIVASAKESKRIPFPIRNGLRIVIYIGSH